MGHGEKMAGNKRKDSTSGSGMIQIMTISLFIILLSFFILLNSIAVVDQRRTRTALDSVLKSFGALAGGYSMQEGHDGVNEVVTPPGVPRVDFSSLVSSKGPLIRQIHALSVSRGSLLRIPSAMLFKAQSTRIEPSAAAFLGRLAGIMRTNTYPIEIMDFVARNETGSRNDLKERELSGLRALALARYLVTREKILPQRLMAYGWGSSHPVYSRLTPATRRLNDRVEVLFVHPHDYQKPEGGFTFKRFFFKVLD
jgi:chemotaxis protein MotB